MCFMNGQWRTMALRGRTMALRGRTMALRGQTMAPFEGPKSNQLYKNGVLNRETRFGGVFFLRKLQTIHRMCFFGPFLPVFW